MSEIFVLHIDNIFVTFDNEVDCYFMAYLLAKQGQNVIRVECFKNADSFLCNCDKAF